MKAGVYETPNNELIYVAKDRTVTAKVGAPQQSSWVGAKVSHRSKDDTVLIDGAVRCTRYAVVPDGCTDHQGLVDGLHAERRVAEKTARHVAAAGEGPSGIVALALPGKPSSGTWRDAYRAKMRLDGWSPVGKQAARRHRRKGHEVIRDADGQQWWQP